MTKVNFLPDDYIEKKAQRRTNVVCLILFLIVTAGLGTGFMFMEQRKQQLDLQVEQTNAEMIKAGESLKQLEYLEEKKKQMTGKAAVSALLMEPVPRSLLLATITNALPPGASLVEVKLATKETTSAKPKASLNKRNRRAPKKNESKDGEVEVSLPRYVTTMAISGLAPTDLEVSSLIGELNKSDLFSQVNLTSSKEFECEDDLLRYFQLALTLDAKARATEDDVQFARRQHVYGM